MSIRIHYKGLDILISSPQEAVALITQLTTDQGGSQPVRGRDEDRWKVTSAFLSALQDTGTQGADVSQIMQALGVKHPKGVGSKSSTVDKSLMELGFPAEEVYGNERTSQGRFWKGAPRLSEAIEAVRSKLEEDEVKRIAPSG